MKEPKWSKWSPTLPDFLEKEGRIMTINDAITTSENPSTHFIVLKSGQFFEMEWDGLTKQRRWREIERNDCRRRTIHCSQYHPLWDKVFHEPTGTDESAEYKPDELEGPIEPDGFRWQNNVHRGLSSLQFDLIRLLWLKPATLEKIEESVWNDSNHDRFEKKLRDP